MQYPDPDLVLDGELGDWLAEFDQERQTAANKGLKRLALTVPFVLAGLLYALVKLDGNWFHQIALALGLLSMCYIWAQAPGRALVPVLKIEINSKIASVMELEYVPYADANFGFECGTYFSVLPEFDRASFEDHWIGDFEDRAFELIEIKLEKERREDNSTYYRTVFHGSILTIATKAEFSNSTLIREKDAIRDWRETYVLSAPHSPVGLGLSEFETGFAQFDEQFECFTGDPDEAKRLITPRIIGEIEHLKSLFPGKNSASAIFHEDHLVVIVESGNMFESGRIGGGSDREIVSETIEQFAVIADVARAV